MSFFYSFPVFSSVVEPFSLLFLVFLPFSLYLDVMLCRRELSHTLSEIAAECNKCAFKIIKIFVALSDIVDLMLIACVIYALRRCHSKLKCSSPQTIACYSQSQRSTIIVWLACVSTISIAYEIYENADENAVVADSRCLTVFSHKIATDFLLTVVNSECALCIFHIIFFLK